MPPVIGADKFGKTDITKEDINIDDKGNISVNSIILNTAIKTRDLENGKFSISADDVSKTLEKIELGWNSDQAVGDFLRLFGDFAKISTRLNSFF